MNAKALILLGIILCVSHTGAIGQGKAVLTGTVLDESTGSSLTGASVTIEGTTIGTIADINGEYTLTNIPEGRHAVRFSFISYENVVMELDFAGGEIREMDVELVPSTVGLEEVVVTTQLFGQRKAISQQLTADAIVNVVSDDKIQELPDVNAAEAIARLPGIALNRSGGEGQKVIIRGMEPKFAAITVNGVRVPSNSSTDRSVDLSLISPELLSGIEVFKAPLPDMDAESSAGTVNLKLRKAPNTEIVQAKLLGGYNALNNDFGDYKGLLQYSNRAFNSKLGVLAQGTIERFNRGGDNISYSWEQGPTDPETGITAIDGSSLGLSDIKEIRKRYNGSINLDYDLNATNSLTFFGIFSRTSRERFTMVNSYNPGEPAIGFDASSSDNVLDLYTLSLGGDHTLGIVKADWSLSSSTSTGSSPRDFDMDLSTITIGGLYDPALNRSGHPRTFLDAAQPKSDEVYLVRNTLYDRTTKENTRSAFLNLQVPLQISDAINGTFKFGGRYTSTERDREVNGLAERFYYLGTDAVWRADDLYDGELIYIPSNSSLISAENFRGDDELGVVLENGEYFSFPGSLDKSKVDAWAKNQESNFTFDRYSVPDNYTVKETVTAGYAMLKMNFGEKLMIIPGFRYEYSDNEYMGWRSQADGTYGQNGDISDTITYQSYGEFFPHLHLKFKPLNWFDVRASYAKTIARPNYNYLIPNAEINHSSGNISAGNPNLSHAITTGYDLTLSFFSDKYGLFTIGGFYKDVENIFIPRRQQLIDEEVASEVGWPGYSGYRLSSYTNLPASKVYGYEMELQTNLGWLPRPFSGLVISLNYARLYSETEAFFLTSQTTYSGGFPPIPTTTYYENERTVAMPTQAPHIFRASLGYDYRGFSFRVSSSFQGTKARSYSLNKDFDSYDLQFWRWDASAKQRIGEKWSVFLNLNNISNQQDIRFIRNENYLENIATYGFTGTIGIQYRFARTKE